MTVPRSSYSVIIYITTVLSTSTTVFSTTTFTSGSVLATYSLVQSDFGCNYILGDVQSTIAPWLDTEDAFQQCGVLCAYDVGCETFQSYQDLPNSDDFPDGQLSCKLILNTYDGGNVLCGWPDFGQEEIYEVVQTV
jgi:hypothetical protein